MELKYTLQTDKTYNSDSFNRTFMELKFVEKTTTKDDKEVLIVPLWNWN